MTKLSGKLSSKNIEKYYKKQLTDKPEHGILNKLKDSGKPLEKKSGFRLDESLATSQYKQAVGNGSEGRSLKT